MKKLIKNGEEEKMKKRGIGGGEDEEDCDEKDEEYIDKVGRHRKKI